MTPTESRYPKERLEIDWEGFPVFSGMRVDDSKLLQEYVSHLHRAVSGENKFPLLSQIAGVPVWVDAFDCPLVAQSVERVSEQDSCWVMPGGASFSVKHDQLYVDPWQRLRCFLGADEIPAVLSRKAQARFLNELSSKTQLKPKELWADVPEISTEARWSEAYTQDKQGWEMGAPNPALVFYGLPKALPAKAKILVPGAGRGHDAHYLAQAGHQVTALDFSPHAEDEFRRLYPKSPVSYSREDVFEHLRAHPKTYDAIFEHTIFCAISPARRREYLEGVLGSLKPGGVYFGLFFVLAWLGGPPFGMTQWELKQLIEGNFWIKAWEISKGSHPARQYRELWAVFEKPQDTRANDQKNNGA